MISCIIKLKPYHNWANIKSSITTHRGICRELGNNEYEVIFTSKTLFAMFVEIQFKKGIYTYNVYEENNS